MMDKNSFNMIEKKTRTRLAPNASGNLRIDTTVATSIGNCHQDIDTNTANSANNSNSFTSNSVPMVSQNYNENGFVTFVGPLITISSPPAPANNSNTIAYSNHSETLSDITTAKDHSSQSFFISNNNEYKNSILSEPPILSETPNEMEGKYMLHAFQNNLELEMPPQNFEGRNNNLIMANNHNNQDIGQIDNIKQFAISTELQNESMSGLSENGQVSYTDFNTHALNNCNKFPKNSQGINQYNTDNLVMCSDPLPDTLTEQFFNSIDSSQSTEFLSSSINSNMRGIITYPVDVQESGYMDGFNDHLNIFSPGEFEERNHAFGPFSPNNANFPLAENNDNNDKGNSLIKNHYSNVGDILAFSGSFVEPDGIVEQSDKLYASVEPSEHDPRNSPQERVYGNLNKGVNSNDDFITSVEQQLLLKQIKSPKKKPYTHRRKSSIGPVIGTPGTAGSSPCLSSKEESFADLKLSSGSNSSVALKLERTASAPNKGQALAFSIGSEKNVINTQKPLALTTEPAPVQKIHKGEYQRQENKVYMNSEPNSSQPQIGLLNFRKPNAWKRSKGGIAAGNEKDSKPNGSKGGETKEGKREDTSEVNVEYSISPED